MTPMKPVPKFFCLVMLLILVPKSSLLSQGIRHRVDSMKQLLSVTDRDVDRGQLYRKIADEFAENNSTEASLYADSAITIGRKLQDTVLIIGGLKAKGTALDHLGKFKESLDCHTQALQMAQSIGNELMTAVCYSGLAVLYSHQEDQHEREKMYIRKALELCEKHYNLNLARCYLSLGMAHFGTENYDSARFYALKAIDIAADSGDAQLLGYGYNNLGTTYFMEKDYANAILYFEKGKSIKEQQGDSRGLVVSYINIGESYGALEKQEAAIEQLDTAIKIATGLRDKYLLSECHLSLSDIYKKAGDYKNAYEVFQKYLLYRDSIFNEQKSDEMLQLEVQFESKQKERENELLKSANEIQAESIRRKDLLNYAVIIGLLLAIGGGIYIFYAYRQKKKANKEISKQKAELEIRNQEVFDSITYAKRIQYTLLANRELLQSYLSEHFVYFKPKDIVSGDFYWAAVNAEGDFYLAVCDSTGHGVPGAFMSLLNISFLNEAISEKQIKAPGEILDHARMRLIDSVSKEGAQDGMDGTLLRFSGGKISYAAANNNPVLVRNGQIMELSADKMPVGVGSSKQFSTHTLECVKGDVVFILTDGYADQFGGPKGKKFKYNQLYQLFEKNAPRSMLEIQQVLTQAHEQWCGSLEQVDDICIVGFRC